MWGPGLCGGVAGVQAAGPGARLHLFPREHHVIRAAPPRSEPGDQRLRPCSSTCPKRPPGEEATSPRPTALLWRDGRSRTDGLERRRPLKPTKIS